MALNPFVYGEVVPRDAFAARHSELDRLISDLDDGQKVFLISPRRYGKSSLIRQALATLTRHGALTVEITVSSYSSYLSFLEGYARALATVETRWERARNWLMQGTDLAAIMAVRQATSRRVTAAGGITTWDEIDRLDAAGVDAVVGMAIYTGQLPLDRAT